MKTLQLLFKKLQLRDDSISKFLTTAAKCLSKFRIKSFRDENSKHPSHKDFLFLYLKTFKIYL